MASDRQGPVPRVVAPDETRPVEVSGHNSRPLPPRPPPPRNSEPPPASRLSTRERLEAAASRFLDALPEGVGIPSDDEEPVTDHDSDDGPAAPLEIELELDGPAADPSNFDEARTKSYRPPVDGQAQIESVLGIPGDDDSAMFRIKAGAVERESPVISSASPPALTEPEHAAITGRTVAPANRPTASKPDPDNDAAVVTGRTVVPGSVSKSVGPAVTGRTMVPGAAQAGSKATPPSMSSLGMRSPDESAAQASPEATEPLDTQEIDLSDIETGDEPVGAAASGVAEVHPRVPAPRPETGQQAPGPKSVEPQHRRADIVATTSAPAAASKRVEPPATRGGVEPPPKRNRAGLGVVLAATVLLAGGGFAAWQTGVLDPWLPGADATPGAATVAASDAMPDVAQPDAAVEPSPAVAADAPDPAEPPLAAGATTRAAPLGPQAEADDGNEPVEAADTDDEQGELVASDDGEPGGETGAPTQPPAEASPEGETAPPPAMPAVGDEGLAAARAVITSDPQRAYELASAVNEDESSDPALEIMATAACAADDGKQARSAFRALGDAEARRRVTDYCLEKTEINVLAKTNGRTWDEHLRRADRQYEAKDYEATLESLRQSRKLKRTPESGVLLVSVYCAQDNMKKARYMLRRMRPQSKDAAVAECESLGRTVGEL